MTRRENDDKISLKGEGFRKLCGVHSIEDDIGTTKNPTCNPNYKTGGKLYKFNCSNCCATYEMRRRGFDVIASPRNTMPAEEWKKLFIDSAPIQLTSRESDKLSRELQEKLSSFGNGARGSIHVEWKGNHAVGHTFSWEVEDGIVRFLDGQNGLTDVLSYFDLIEPTRTICLRWDNLEPSDLVKKACKNRGGV